ncbi:voltage-dependent calcium channel subunit alpha-2/delta-3-like [Hydractinia symbiolongicarpus]|uniref:voltage-dependent calcium channel subunit alpha-2/delta-3-like n=1 Tax=Hydractinia symbiolongicarpus TaxID=13093 RepID=UPI00254A30B8|nr:voltage-dependent calcium channel subunit alpha-2/delta-3-like [Hydractinia symbiolongicarpus]
MEYLQMAMKYGTGCILLIVFLCENASLEIQQSHVRTWSSQIELLLHSVVDNGLNKSNVQDTFDNLNYAQKKQNGGSMLKQASARLSAFFKDRESIVKNLASEVKRLYQGFTQTSSYYADLLNKTTELHLLPKKYFIDTDSNQKEHLSYSSLFGQPVNFNQSFVKLPNQVDRSNNETIATVIWAAGLDKQFKKHKEESGILWQYFASHLGVYRVYPGFEWERNFIGFSLDFDPRIRPWYVSAISGPKDVVVILDCSTSMKGRRFELSKDITKTILQTLTHDDHFTIICGRASHWDKNGNWHEYIYDGEVVGCNKDALVRADSKNREDYLKGLDQIKPGGTSEVRLAFRKAFNMIRKRQGCQSIIIFTTDGHDNDGEDVRCNQGQYARTGNFVPGKQCQYKWSKVFNEVKRQKKLSGETRIFTYLIDSNEEKLAGQLACDNGGAMKKIATRDDLLSQMFDYYNYLTINTIRDNNIVWSAPYLDGLGFGRMVTCTIPVVSHSNNQTIGVVAVDLSLSEIDKILSNFTWGDVYAFVINKDGQAIFHPALDPKSGVFEQNMPYVSIFDLELNNGKPKKFKDLILKMVSGESGSMHILDAVAYDFHLSANKRMISEPANFFYAPIADTGYSFAFKIPDRDYIIYDDVLKKKNARDVMGSQQHFSHNTSSSLDVALRFFKEEDKMGKYRKGTCLEILNRSLFSTKHIPSFPGFKSVALHKDTSENWYEASVNNPSVIIVTKTKQNNQSVVKISSAILPALAIPSKNECSIESNANGCACEGSSDCASSFCREFEIQRRCSSMFIESVVAADILYNNFHTLMTTVMSSHSAESSCWKGCEAHLRNCTTKCFLIDDHGYIVYHPLGEAAENIKLMDDESTIMELLIKKYNIFKQKEKKDFQAICKISDSIPMVKTVNKSIGINLFRNEYVCLKHHSVLERTDKRNYSLATAVNAPCVSASMFVEDIIGTNIMLLVLDNYTRYVNKECAEWYKRKETLRSDTDGWCDHRHDVHLNAPDVERSVHMSECPNLRNINLKCSYNYAIYVTSTRKIIYLSFLFWFLVCWRE